MFWTQLSMITTISIFIGVIIALVIVLFWVKNCFKLHSLKFKTEALQKPELIKGKMFICQDQYHLKVQQKMVKNSKYLILGIHDFKTNMTEFSQLQSFLDEQEKFSYLFYDQRGVGQNEPVRKFNQASLLADLSAIIEDISQRYEQKIIIIASGISASAAMHFSTNPKIAQIIVPNITLNQPYQKKSGLSFQRFIFASLSLNGLLAQSYSGYDFANTKQVAQELDKLHLETGLLTYQEYLQNKRMQKRLIKNINQAIVPITLFLLNNDFYCNKNNLTKFLTLLKNPELKTIQLPDEKHFWVWEANNKKFNFLLQNVD